MGLLDWRKRKIAENAKAHMEPGEEVREMAISQTAPSWITGSAKSKVHAVIATDANLYLMAIHDWKPISVEGAVASYRLGEIDLRLDGGELVFGDYGRLSLLVGAGKDGKRLVEYVAARRGPEAPA